MGRVYKKYYTLLENSFLANLAGFAVLTIYLEYFAAFVFNSLVSQPTSAWRGKGLVN